MQIIEGAESFLLEGKNNKAVLLLHGYTGAPSEMRPLGDYLHALGYTVSCVLPSRPRHEHQRLGSNHRDGLVCCCRSGMPGAVGAF